MIKPIYPQWRAERGIVRYYKLIEFIEFIKDRGTIVRFQIGNTYYIGEKWLAEDVETGVQKEVIFRQEDYLPVADEESSVYIFSEIIPDNWANPIVDEPELVEAHSKSSSYIKRGDFKNRGLEQFARLADSYIYKFIEFINSLQKDSKLYKLAELKLQFITRPDLYNARAWKKVPEREKKFLDKHFKSYKR